MKRNERNTLNQLKKTVTGDTLNVEVPVSFSIEAKQAIHEMLTFKGLAAVRINWNNIENEYAIHYIYSASAADQENEQITDIERRLPKSDYTWNSYKKADSEPEKEGKTEMKQTEKKTGKYERDAARVDAILAKGSENITAADRAELISIYNVSWHDSGKIEGAFSLDSSCNGCTFCQHMRELAQDNGGIICGKCYDAKQEARWRTVKQRHALNLRIMANVDFTVDELSRLAGSGIVRVNSSGDFENETHAGNMVKYAIGHSWARVGIWAKHCEAVEKAFDKYGKPANVVYIASSLFINKRRPLPKYADYTFTVYTADKIQEAIENGSMECNGKKCNACNWSCYFGTWPKGSDIAELLR